MKELFEISRYLIEILTDDIDINTTDHYALNSIKNHDVYILAIFILNR